MMGTASNHDCRSFAREVILYLDGALTREQDRNLLLEMRTCPQCLEKYSKEKAFREFIKSKVSRRKVSPTLVQSIKDKIQLSAVL